MNPIDFLVQGVMFNCDAATEGYAAGKQWMDPGMELAIYESLGQKLWFQYVAYARYWWMDRMWETKLTYWD